MILLTRLDNSRILVNIETIKYAEATPDTIIAFVNGDSVIVRESLEEIDRGVVDYRARVIARTRSLSASSPTPDLPL